MSLRRTKVRIKRDAKIVGNKINIQRKVIQEKAKLQGKRLRKSIPKLKKKLPKLRKKALARGKEIEDYFREGIDPKNLKII